MRAKWKQAVAVNRNKSTSFSTKLDVGQCMTTTRTVKSELSYTISSQILNIKLVGCRRLWDEPEHIICHSCNHMMLHTISNAWISDYYNTGTELTGWSGSDHVRLHTLHTDPAHFEEVGPCVVWLASAIKEVDCSWVMSQSCWLLSWSAFLNSLFTQETFEKSGFTVSTMSFHTYTY